MLQGAPNEMEAVKRCDAASPRSRWPRASSVNTWLCTVRRREADSSAVPNQFKTNLEDVTRRQDEIQAAAASAYKEVKGFV